MLQRLKDILFGEAARGDSPEASFDETAFAAAALMAEAARLDGHFDGNERESVLALLRDRFELDEASAEALLAAADARIDRSPQILPFTRTIKDRLGEAERIELDELLWEVIYADGRARDYEAGLVRRIGGLVYVQDVDRGAARKRALARLGLAGDDAPQRSGGPEA